MQIKSISWEHVGNEHCLWRGKAEGLFSHLFFITATGKDRDEYLLRTDINGIPNETCIGLEKTKAKAQELFNSYTFSLIIP